MAKLVAVGAGETHLLSSMTDTSQSEYRGVEGVGGWLLLLCRLLVVFHPLSLAITASNALSALSARGTAVALILLLRLAVVGFGMAAGRALQTVQPGAVVWAKRRSWRRPRPTSSSTPPRTFRTTGCRAIPSTMSLLRWPITARGSRICGGRAGSERPTPTCSGFADFETVVNFADA